MSRPARRALAACALLAVTLAGCSSSGPADRRHATRCRPAALAAPLFGGSDGVLQVYPHSNASGKASVAAELLRIDRADGHLVARCLGATALAVLDPGSPLNNQDSVAVLGATRSSAEQLPAFDYRPDHTGGSATAVVDWRTGQQRRLRFAGYHILSVTPHGLLLQTDASAHPTASGHVAAPTRAPDFCLLPSVTAPRSQCTAVPGASGAGFARPTPDGSVRWVRLALVRAAFGSLHGYALTDGSGVVAFGLSRTGIGGRTGGDAFAASLDGRTVLDVSNRADAPVRWATVTLVDGAGVHGVLHTSSVPQTDVQVRSDGFMSSPDGKTLYLLTGSDTPDDLTLVSIGPAPARPQKLTITPPAGDALSGDVATLLYWPTPAG